MSKFAILATKLWPHLRKLLIRVGRWVIRAIRKRGAQTTSLYMRIRAEDVFTSRLKRARTKRRKKWLRGRIKRWLKIADWLDDKESGRKINKRVADELEKLAIADRIPVSAPWEKRAA